MSFIPGNLILPLIGNFLPIGVANFAVELIDVSLVFSGRQLVDFCAETRDFLVSVLILVVIAFLKNSDDLFNGICWHSNTFDGLFKLLGELFFSDINRPFAAFSSLSPFFMSAISRVRRLSSASAVSCMRQNTK